MKFGQLIEYNKKNSFFRNHGKNKLGRLVPDLSSFFWKALDEVKVSAMVCSLVLINFDSPQVDIQLKKLYKTLDYWSRDMLHFDFLEKGLGIVSPTYFVFNFVSINWQSFIVWLPLLLEIWGNMCIAIVYFLGCS